MMVSVETYLLRGKRRWDQWSAHPGFRYARRLLLFGGGGLLLSGAALWGEMMPLVSGWILGIPGKWGVVAAAGSMVGYRLFWGMAGLQGVVWSLGALVLGVAIRLWVLPEDRPEFSGGALALLTVGVGLYFHFFLGDNTPVSLFLLRAAAAGGSGLLFAAREENRDTLWITCGLGILALEQIRGFPWLRLGCFCAGAIAAAAPIPAAAMAGIALEAGGVAFMTAAVCLTCFFRRLPIRDLQRRMLAPALGFLTSMVFYRQWTPIPWLSFSLGGLLGAAIPWNWAVLPAPGSRGGVQVRLEQAARVLLQLQRGLMDATAPPIDRDAILRQIQENACGNCSCRGGCQERLGMDSSILKPGASVVCRRSGRLLPEVLRGREQLRFLRGQRRQMGEYRGALLQQYGFLAGYLQLLADGLPIRPRAGNARFHIQVSARSRGKELANGDRCIAFPGAPYRYYVVLCDGMGTGLGAAAEGNQAADLLKQMLTAGLPPQYAMGNINAQLALRSQAGAVTMDLAEICLDTGGAAVYKWGAAQSILFRRRRAEKIGTVTPPPGISVTETPESVARLSLGRGEVLVLASDGIELSDTSELAALAESASPGELAGYILKQCGGSGEDDATAAVIRLRPVNLAT